MIGKEELLNKAILNDSVINHMCWIKYQIISSNPTKAVLNDCDVKIIFENEETHKLLSKIDEQIYQRIQYLKNLFS